MFLSRKITPHPHQTTHLARGVGFLLRLKYLAGYGDFEQFMIQFNLFSKVKITINISACLKQSINISTHKKCL